MKLLAALSLLLLVASFGSGCVYTSYAGKDAVKMTRISVFGNQSAGKVDLQKGTIEGYVSEQAEVAGAVAGAVAKALAKP